LQARTTTTQTQSEAGAGFVTLARRHGRVGSRATVAAAIVCTEPPTDGKPPTGGRPPTVGEPPTDEKKTNGRETTNRRKTTNGRRTTYGRKKHQRTENHRRTENHQRKPTNGRKTLRGKSPSREGKGLEMLRRRRFWNWSLCNPIEHIWLQHAQHTLQHPQNGKAEREGNCALPMGVCKRVLL